MPTSLDQLRAAGTMIVSDTGDYEIISEFKPQDATTNVSLILEACDQTKYRHIIDLATDYGKVTGRDLAEQVDASFNRLLVEFGKETLKIIPGKVSIEIDSRSSFDTKSLIEKALHIVKLFESFGIEKSRFLLKIASTWEGIQAVKVLQNEFGINCNCTLLFSKIQAIAAAEAGAYIISPFVWRILEWHQTSTGRTFTKEEHPGVAMVKEIFQYFKKYGSKTLIMGASFRSVDEITELAGCDALTIPPNILQELVRSTKPVPRKLDAEQALGLDIKRQTYINDESTFRFEFNEDVIAVEKMRQLISKFAADAEKLRDILKRRLER